MRGRSRSSAMANMSRGVTSAIELSVPLIEINAPSETKPAAPAPRNRALASASGRCEVASVGSVPIATKLDQHVQHDDNADAEEQREWKLFSRVYDLARRDDRHLEAAERKHEE